RVIFSPVLLIARGKRVVIGAVRLATPGTIHRPSGLLPWSRPPPTRKLEIQAQAAGPEGSVRARARARRVPDAESARAPRTWTTALASNSAMAIAPSK